MVQTSGLSTQVRSPIDLAGKRVAAVSFDDFDTARISAFLDCYDAFCRPQKYADLQSIASGKFDAWVCLFEPDAQSLVHLETALQQQIRPAILLVGTSSQLTIHHQMLVSADGFLFRETWNEAELLLRLGNAFATRHPRVDQPKPTSSRLRVLIADDDPSITTLLRVMLEKNDMDCQLAPDGGRALDMVQELKPDLFILDVNMPHRDGFEVLASLRRIPELESTKVILLTACEQETDILRGFGLGADDYVVKPFNPMEVVARIKRLSGRAR